MYFSFLSRINNTASPLPKPIKSRLIQVVRNRFLKCVFYFKTNKPFVSGDSISSVTDYYVYGRNSKKKLNMKKLLASGSISVPGHLFQNLLDELSSLPNLRTIVTCNSDENFTTPIKLPKQIKLWLCQNNAISNDARIHTLPIGIENIRLVRSGFPNIHRPQSRFEIEDKILVPPMALSNVVRSKVLYELKQRNSNFDIKLDYLSTKDYFTLTRKYRFILALEGNGFENHRIWEALYQNSFPVLLRSEWALTLSELNLPIMYINSVSEVTSTSLNDFLSKHKDFLASKHEALWIPYWKEIIETGVFRNPNSGYLIH